MYVCVADVASVDKMEWGMYIRGHCSPPRVVMLQLRPQSRCHLRSSVTSAVVFLKSQCLNIKV